MTRDNTIITLSAGKMELELWSTGARLNQATWNGAPGLLDSSATMDEAVGDKLNNGSVIGPLANRLAGAAFELEGNAYGFPPNEGTRTLLHSGDKSLRDFNWRLEDSDDSSAHFVAKVGELVDGFPGNRRFEAIYSVAENGFDVTFLATSDAPTFVNMALHPYWRLDAGGRDDLQLAVNADTYLPIDAEKIPTGKVADVDDTIFDLREASVPSVEIDHNFCLSPATDDKPSASLASATTQLIIWTDAPGLQVFTGKDIGIAIEPQHWPDTPHHPNFPSVRLDPGETYRQHTRYRFRSV